VKKKIFLIVAEDAEGWGVTIKLDESHASALSKRFVSPTRYGLGKHGWVTARFGPNEDASLDLLKRWATESFTVVAPLKVLQELEGKEAARPRKKRR
jgi:hypothetical protein